MKSPASFYLLAVTVLLQPRLRAAVVVTAESARSPENQVFQFMQRETFAYAADSTVDATAYLWIPEKCARLRGLLIFGQNVTEHSLVGHAAIRGACAANDLGIVWTTPSFFSTKNKEPGKTVAFLQHLLDGLASSSGYAEVAAVPWLPLGESGHLLMVDQLLDGAPARCIAGIYVKNAHYFCQNRVTPILVAVGTAQEWDQDKIDIRSRWNDLAFYRAIITERAAHPRWPVSLLIDGGSGHFECPEPMARYFAAYIAAAVKARVPSDPAQGLLPIGERAGFVAGFALPVESPRRPIALAQAVLADQSLPWFFNETLANEASASAAINWQAASQLPAFLDAAGKVAPMLFRGVTNPVPLETGADGISFTIRGCLLPARPENFAAAGQLLAQAPGEPSPEWVCGPITPLGGGRFRIALDRTWPKSPVVVALRHPGTPAIRAAVQPGYLSLKPNAAGAAQSITFATIPDQAEGTVSIPLAATADSGLPVDFFVVAGPAVVEHGRLVFAPLPPRARRPVKVTVTAWQWGRSAEPRVRTATPVTRSIFITAAPAATNR